MTTPSRRRGLPTRSTNPEASGSNSNGKINTVERSHDTLEITAIYRGHKSRMGKNTTSTAVLCSSRTVSSGDYRSPPGCQHLILPKLGVKLLPRGKNRDPFFSLSLLYATYFSVRLLFGTALDEIFFPSTVPHKLCD